MRACRFCRTRFEPWINSLQSGCSIDCLAELARKDRERKAAEARKVERATDRAKKEAMKSWRKLNGEAQEAFNGFIRARDAGLPCICCGAEMGPQRPGGAVDAGHFRSRGSAPQLRFNEDNCFAQRKNCNRPGAADRQQFEAGVLARIGQHRLDAVLRDHAPRHYTKDELREIRDRYSRLARELKRDQP